MDPMLCTGHKDMMDSMDVDEIEVDELALDITIETAAKNYEEAGGRVQCDPSTIVWERYQHLFNHEVKLVLEKVISQIDLKFKLSEFQEIFLHAIGSKQDLFAVTGTVSGKTEVTAIAALVLREIYKDPEGLMVIFVPLTGILDEMLANQNVQTAAVSMNGQMFCLTESGRALVKEEDLLHGKFARLVMHPEALKNKIVEKLMLQLKQSQKIIGVVVDEFHVIQPHHWSTFRPEMEEQMARLRVFLRKGAPTAALSATASESDVAQAVDILGLKGDPVILAQTPLQSQHKFILLRRPSDNYGFDGVLDQNDKFHPGLLEQLRIIYIDKFVRSIRNGEDPKHAIIFFRTENQLIKLFNYLRQTLAVSNARTAPFVCLVASTPPVTEMMINNRKGKIALYLTTQKMLLGVNVPQLDICIFVKPMNTAHSILQGAGRTGRPLPMEPGMRTKAVIYILSNGGDIGGQVNGMSDQVRDLVHFKTGCLRVLLASYFLGSQMEVPRSREWCCSFCSR